MSSKNYENLKVQSRRNHLEPLPIELSPNENMSQLEDATPSVYDDQDTSYHHGVSINSCFNLTL